MKSEIKTIIQKLESIKNNRYTKLRNIQSSDFCQQSYIKFNKSNRKLPLLELYKKIITNKNYVKKIRTIDIPKRNTITKDTITKDTITKDMSTSRSPKRKIPDTILNKSENNEKIYDSLDNVTSENDRLFNSRIYKKIKTLSDNPIFENYEIMRITHIEPILVGIVILLYDKFIIIDDKQKLEFLKALKLKLGIDLEKKNLYSKFGYNKKRFKKSDLQYKLVNNEINIGNRLYCYIGDYFDINIIQIKGKIIEYYNDYSNDRHNIILHYNQENEFVEIQYNYINNSIISPELWEKYKKKYNLKESFIKKRKNLLKLNLADIQLKAKNLGINIEKIQKTKMGKKTKKTKKDLIDEIEYIYMGE